MRRPVAYVAGTGRGVPDKVMPNHDFAASISPGNTPARAIAARAAVDAMEQVVSSGAAMRRSTMPVRSTIQSWFVSSPSAAKS